MIYSLIILSSLPFKVMIYSFNSELSLNLTSYALGNSSFILTVRFCSNNSIYESSVLKKYPIWRVTLSKILDSNKILSWFSVNDSGESTLLTKYTILWLLSKIDGMSNFPLSTVNSFEKLEK